MLQPLSDIEIVDFVTSTVGLDPSYLNCQKKKEMDENQNDRIWDYGFGEYLWLDFGRLLLQTAKKYPTIDHEGVESMSLSIAFALNG